jgi:hypothetical protein
MKMEQTECSETRRIEFGHWRITQKKECNIQNTAEVWNQEWKTYIPQKELQNVELET